MSDRWDAGRRSRRIVGVVVALAALMAAGPAGSVAAAPVPGAVGPPMSVSIELFDPCFGLTNATGTDPIVVIHRRDGVRVGRASVPISDFMRPCTGTLRPKDAIELRQSGARLRLLTIPSLRLRVDLAGHRVTGRVPFGSGSATVRVDHRIAGLEVHEEGGTVSPAVDGTFAWAPSTPANLWPGDIARLTWTSAEFDTFRLLASTPSVTVSTWTARITATAARASRVAIADRVGQRLRASYARQLPPYEVLTYGQLKRNGAPVRPVKGDTITHGGIEGVALTVLPNAITVDPSDDGSLTTTCFPRGQVVVDTNDQHRAAFNVPASGIVNALNLTQGEGDLQPGDTILVGCQNRKGGAQLKRYVVP